MGRQWGGFFLMQLQGKRLWSELSLENPVLQRCFSLNVGFTLDFAKTVVLMALIGVDKTGNSRREVS